MITNNYFEAINRPNVKLEGCEIESFTASGIKTKNQTEHTFDLIVLATGFTANEFLAPMKVKGPNSKTLFEGADYRAYLGITVPDFPNFFMTYGPNTNLGHHSIIFMIEQQVYLIGKLMEVCLRQKQFAKVCVRRDVWLKYNETLQK